MKLVINEVREDERRHRDIFRKMMLDYGTRPCRLTWIWVFSGFFLGIVTALLGKRGMLISMKAMETTAHEHLGIQVSYLKYKKYEIYKIIEEIQIEEIKHVSIADKEIGTQKMSKFDIFIYKNVYRLCQLTMWVVTKGESTKLRNFLFLQSKA
jgi:ubiquinone biosynthesis monooxygenase Coq7